MTLPLFCTNCRATRPARKGTRWNCAHCGLRSLVVACPNCRSDAADVVCCPSGPATICDRCADDFCALDHLNEQIRLGRAADHKCGHYARAAVIGDVLETLTGAAYEVAERLVLDGFAGEPADLAVTAEAVAA